MPLCWIRETIVSATWRAQSLSVTHKDTDLAPKNGVNLARFLKTPGAKRTSSSDAKPRARLLRSRLPCAGICKDRESLTSGIDMRILETRSSSRVHRE